MQEPYLYSSKAEIQTTQGRGTCKVLSLAVLGLVLGSVGAAAVAGYL